MVHSVRATLLSLLICISHVKVVSSFSTANQDNSRQRLVNIEDPVFKRTCSSKIGEYPTHIVFPGGGIFFYWQAGVVTYLREAGYDLSKFSMSGASAGALTATLAAADVDFYDATKLALKLAGDGGVWDRRGGLQGIWGPMIQTWLAELLPPDVLEKVEGRLQILITPIPSFGKSRIDSFKDRSDLIECNMASVHLPFFMDGRLTHDFRGSPFIDGSFLSKTNDYLPPRTPKNIVRIDWQIDPEMNGRALEFVTAVSEKSIWNIVEQGKAYARKLDKEGGFEKIRS